MNLNSDELAQNLRKIVGDEYVFTDVFERIAYAEVR